MIRQFDLSSFDDRKPSLALGILQAFNEFRGQ